MATVKELKATARPRAGKGAARALRRQGSVPGVIYGGKEPPVPIALEHVAVRNNIYAGRFLTTIYHLDLDGKTHRVIPRDYQLDPVKGVPLDRKSTRLNSSHLVISYAVFCLKKKKSTSTMCSKASTKLEKR